MKGIPFFESSREREERESLERMHMEHANIENIRTRQRNGENLELYTNYLGHLRLKGEADPDVTFCIQNDESIWFPEPWWKGGSGSIHMHMQLDNNEQDGGERGVEAVSLEEFRRGKIPCQDHGMLAFPHGCSKAQARRNEKYFNQYLNERNKALIDTRKEYEELLAAGKIREPTVYESLYRKASGHPDNESVQAARRILKKKYGVDYHDTETENQQT